MMMLQLLLRWSGIPILTPLHPMKSVKPMWSGTISELWSTEFYCIRGKRERNTQVITLERIVISRNKGLRWIHWPPAGIKNISHTMEKFFSIWDKVLFVLTTLWLTYVPCDIFFFKWRISNLFTWNFAWNPSSDYWNISWVDFSHPNSLGINNVPWNLHLVFIPTDPC